MLNQGYGHADKEKAKVIESDSQFIVALSLQWPAFAALAFRLRQEGRLNLDDSVCAYAKSGESFQTASLPNGARVRADNGNLEALYSAMSGVIARDATVYALSPFLSPLKLKTIGAYRAINDTNVALPHDAALPLDPLYAKFPPYVVSAADLHRFLQALFGGELLTVTQLDEMLKPNAEVDGAPGNMSYGLGVYVGTDPTGRRVVSQVDVAAGFGSYWAYYPDDKLTVIVLNHVTDWANQPYRARDVGLELARRIGEAR